MRRAPTSSAALLVLATFACDAPSPAIASPEVAPELAAPRPADPPPAVEPAARVVPIPELSPFTPALVERLRAIRGTSDRRQDDVFMKVGDSSTVSRGFLECFADPGEVDLGGRDELAPTLDWFRNRNAAGRDSYRRRSRAAAEGWSARHVLEGSPPPLLVEVRAIRPRFAFVMNGGNDVEGADDYRYAQRMWRIVEQLEENGVIPVLSATPPRTDDPARDREVDRYNEVGWGLARARRLPYLDYHQVMRALPRWGLAGDGVHPNVLVEGSRGRACRLDEAGLRYGHNARNLLALRALDRLRRTVVAGEPAPDPAEPAPAGAGTAGDPLRLTTLPFAAIVDTRTEGSDAIDRYDCAPDADESGREVVYRLVLDAPIALRVVAVGREDVDVDVHLLREAEGALRCVERADREIVRTLEPGAWRIAIDTFAGGGTPRSGEALVVVSPRVVAAHGVD